LALQRVDHLSEYVKLCIVERRSRLRLRCVSVQNIVRIVRLTHDVIVVMAVRDELFIPALGAPLIIFPFHFPPPLRLRHVSLHFTRSRPAAMRRGAPSFPTPHEVPSSAQNCPFATSTSEATPGSPRARCLPCATMRPVKSKILVRHQSQTRTIPARPRS